jgi:integrase
MAKLRQTSYDVRIWGVSKIKGSSGKGANSRRRTSGMDNPTTYRLRWSVAGQRQSKSFATKALADSRRAELVTAARRGEAFDVETGWPVSMLPTDSPITWWEWAGRFVEMKWHSLAPTSRRSVAEALSTVTLEMTDGTSRGPSARVLRSVMFGWAFNALRRAADPPAEMQEAVAWLERHSRRLTDLDDPTLMRAVLDAVARKQDGTPAAATTTARKRAVLHQALEFAVEQEVFEVNPLSRVRWKAPKVAEAFDPRAVVNPAQARALLAGVRTVGEQDERRLLERDHRMQERITGIGVTSRRLVAFFGCMYYSALRPSEALDLHDADLDLPPEDAPADTWGRLLLSRSNPEIATRWTDDGQRKSRQLKHRARGTVRPVPCPPELVALLRAHLKEPGPAPDGRLFYGPYGGTITSETYNDVWERARQVALTPAEQGSPLARRPYDLRHTAVSGWLASGVDSALVAAWAGHSVAVLHRVYVHVVKGRDDDARRRIAEFLNEE